LLKGADLPANLFKKGLITNLFKKLLDHKPFEKRFDRKPWQLLDLIVLSPDPICVINRRNGFDQPAQRLRLNG